MATATVQDDITIIHLTPEEVNTKTLTSHNLQAAVTALHNDGIVVLNNAVSITHLDKLNARMVPEAQKLYA